LIFSLHQRAALPP